LTDEYDFDSMLSKSVSEEDRKWWKRVLPGGWPWYDEVQFCEGRHKQPEGRDSVVSMRSRHYETELKLRETFYPDLLIEVWHGDTEKDGWPGWIEKLRCDFLAYGWRPANRAIVVSVPKLRQVYLAKKWSERPWVRNRFPTKASDGRQWWTWNVQIPLREVDKLVGYWDCRDGVSAQQQKGLFE